ncbi:hypothetical protein [Halarcobacter sp.]|uniref:hypothetical protein n=1 Tax=Halarcobacter sp. TaxID=2321133 RepID=UPI002AAB16E5|nr:hypothetical protein [Halarcobacter sp.]
MKYIFIISTALFFISCTQAEETNSKNKVQTTEKKQEMSKEDVDKWFKEYMALDKETEKLKAENKKLDKLNNTLDELINMIEVKK